jgi:hypothetical protein
MMLNLELPFQLIARGPGALSQSSLPELRRSTTAEVILEGLSISIKAGRKTYEVSSDRPPEHDGTGSFRRTTWARWLWPLIDGMSIEQQMMMPMGGDAVAISWRTQRYEEHLHYLRKTASAFLEHPDQSSNASLPTTAKERIKDKISGLL